MNISNTVPSNHTQIKQNAQKEVFRRPPIPYEVLVWIIFSIVAILAVLDRLTTNLWPRQSFTIGKGFAGKDKIDGLLDGPWSVKVYDILARVSGRYSIVALNLLLFTRMKTFNFWISETWIAKTVVDFSDSVEGNLRLHKWNGITLVVMTLLHVWSILFPCIFNGWRSQVLSGTFEWILSERKPPGFKDANALTQTMSLQVDDVFRLVEMTLFLAILMPISIRWMATRWHIGIHLHGFIAIVYFIDIVRRHTHPHSWVLNTPFFVAWIIDQIVGYFWRMERPEMHRMQLGTDYLILFWKQRTTLHSVGPKFFLRLKDSSLLERAHVFTGMENRKQLDIFDRKDWSSCLLIRVYHSKRKPALGKKDKISHTHRVATVRDMKIRTWGPFLGGMSDQVRYALREKRNITLVAGGSGACYLFDAMQLHEGEQLLTVLYTVRDEILFSWVCDVMAKILDTSENIRVIVALTSGKEEGSRAKALVAEKRVELSSRIACSASDSDDVCLRAQHGRIKFTAEIEEENVVFCQGSASLQALAKQVAKGNNCKFVCGDTFDQGSQSRQNVLLKLRSMFKKKGNDELV